MPHLLSFKGVPALAFEAEGPVVSRGADINDFIGAAWGTGVEALVIPRQRLADTFFDLRTGLAGEVTQKCVNHGLRLVVVGDLTAELAGSRALRDYVRECNRGKHVQFVVDLEGTPVPLPA